MNLPDWLVASWPHITSAVAISASIIASGHALLYKRDVRAAIGWVSIIWFVPVLGALFYVLLGINRIRRKAIALHGGSRRYHLPPSVRPARAADVGEALSRPALRFSELAQVVGQVTTRPLVSGNRVTPLIHGDEAFPAMLEAIDGAERSISLSTYIFDIDPAGRLFVDALGRAKERGVEVRVLIDAAGVRYSRPHADDELKRRGVPADLFLSAWLWRRAAYFNLRNHRKILVVDGKLGFTGGMNIRHGHMTKDDPRHPVSDVHFRLQGPVVTHLQEVFAEDWEFTTGETLRGEAWFPELEPVGETLARGIADGPDEDFEQIRWTLLGALACAHSSIRVVTPYFLPDQALITLLRLAALRRLRVDIVLPEKGNIPLVQWACWAQLWQVLEPGCRVWLVPPPFDHSKLVVIDDHWVLLGSANWDPRSLRLNFELCVECYDVDLATGVHEIIDDKIARARQLTFGEVESRSIPVRLRDGAARLLSPYL